MRTFLRSLIPMRATHRSVAALLAAGFLTLAACGGASDDSRETDTAAADSAATADAGEAEAVETIDVTPADVDAYVRGLEARVDTVRVLARDAGRRRNEEGSVERVLTLTNPQSFRTVEARASGLPEERYFTVADELHNGVLALTGGADSSTAAGTLARFRPETRAALERRVSRIKALTDEEIAWKNYAGDPNAKPPAPAAGGD